MFANDWALADDAELSADLARIGELAEPIARRGDMWGCYSQQSYSCSVSGCSTGNATVVVFLDFRGTRYIRCTRKESGEIVDCASEPATVGHGGIYTTVAPAGKLGSSIKVVNDGSEFVDTATLGTGAYINFGTCKRVEKSP